MNNVDLNFEVESLFELIFVTEFSRNCPALMCISLCLNLYLICTINIYVHCVQTFASTLPNLALRSNWNNQESFHSPQWGLDQVLRKNTAVVLYKQFSLISLGVPLQIETSIWPLKLFSYGLFSLTSFLFFICENADRYQKIKQILICILYTI